MRILPEIITTEYIISQALGFVALALVCVGYFCKKRKLIVFQILANLTTISSFFFLGATFAAYISTIIATFRHVCFYIYERKNMKVPTWFLSLIIFLYIATCATFGRGANELLQLIGTLNFTIAFLIRDEIKLRLLILFSCALFIVYNLTLMNFFGVVTSSVEFSIVFVSLIVFIKRKKKNG